MTPTGFQIILAGSLVRFAWDHQAWPMVVVFVMMTIIFVADLAMTADREDRERKAREVREAMR